MKKSAGILIYRFRGLHRPKNIRIKADNNNHGLKRIDYKPLIDTDNNQRKSVVEKLYPRKSLVNNKCESVLEILLVHPGGPFWKNKDINSWSIPKGEIEINENLKDAAIREFEEETGLKLTKKDKNKIFYLCKVKSKNKIVYIFALEKDFGNKFEVKSKLIKLGSLEFPEIDKAKYFDLKNAKIKLVNYQKSIIDIINQKILVLTYIK